MSLGGPQRILREAFSIFIPNEVVYEHIQSKILSLWRLLLLSVPWQCALVCYLWFSTKYQGTPNLLEPPPQVCGKYFVAGNLSSINQCRACRNKSCLFQRFWSNNHKLSHLSDFVGWRCHLHHAVRLQIPFSAVSSVFRNTKIVLIIIICVSIPVYQHIWPPAYYARPRQIR